MVNRVETKKESVTVYCAEVAQEILLKEGPGIELNCVAMNQRVCSTPDEINSFYGVEPSLAHECPECGGIGFIDDERKNVCVHCTNYAVNRTRGKNGI